MLLACFRHFPFLTQTKCFAWAIAFAFWPFLAIFKWSHFSNITCFLQPFFAYNNFDVFVEMFLPCFRQFYFLTQTKCFALAIAFALWPFLAIFKMVSFFEY